MAEEFSARLRRLRTQKDLTQLELADAAGITKAHVSHLETGARNKRNMEFRTQRGLASALGVTWQELMGECRETRP